MNVAITWPRSRPLGSYLEECQKAVDADRQINFRVPSMPQRVFKGDRCYVVYDGRVVGWNIVISVASRDDVIDPITTEYLRPGFYIVRDPRFIGWPGNDGPRIKSFQGFRYARTLGLP